MLILSTIKKEKSSRCRNGRICITTTTTTYYYENTLSVVFIVLAMRFIISFFPAF